MVDEILHDLRHAADNGILQQQLSQSLVERCRNGRRRVEATLEKRNDRLADAVRPKKFLKIERPHRADSLVADRHRARLAIARDAEERARRNHIEPPVDLEKLQRRPRLGARLDFIKDEQRLARYELHIRWQERRHHHHEMIDRQRLGKDVTVLGVFQKVQIHDGFVVLPRKRQHGIRLAALAAAFQDERLMIRLRFPVAHLSLEHPHPFFQEHHTRWITLFQGKFLGFLHFFNGKFDAPQYFFRK